MSAHHPNRKGPTTASVASASQSSICSEIVSAGTVEATVFAALYFVIALEETLILLSV